MAVPDTISTRRSPRPSQPVTWTPARSAIGEALGEGRLALADRPRPADGARSAAWRRVEQSGIEAQAGDHAKPAAQRIEQLDGGEAGVGDRDDATLGQPAHQL